MTTEVMAGQTSVRAAAELLRDGLTGAQRSRVLHEVRRDSTSDEWLTPPHIVDRVRLALGGSIDVDVCADRAHSVPATRHITADDNALGEGSWRTLDGAPARAFMNPPYGAAGSGQWVRRLLREYAAGNVLEAIALLPARLGTEWLSALGEWPRVELTGRLAFVPGPDNPAHGKALREAHFTSLIIGIGVEPRRLHEAFGDLGQVMVRWVPPTI